LHSKIVKILLLQEKIIDELGNEMDSTSNRLDFVQVSFSPSSFHFLIEVEINGVILICKKFER
jgi:hypothetical protein